MRARTRAHGQKNDSEGRRRATESSTLLAVAGGGWRRPLGEPLPTSARRQNASCCVASQSDAGAQVAAVEGYACSRRDVVPQTPMELLSFGGDNVDGFTRQTNELAGTRRPVRPHVPTL